MTGLLTTNTDSINGASDHYGSIQVVPLESSDESASLLQHRHHVPPTSTSTTSLQHAEPQEDHGNHHAPPDTSSPAHHPVKKYLHLYLEMVETRPLVTKSITATILLGGADLCAQGLEHARHVNTVNGVDWPRAGRFALFGFFGAPWSHYYFHALDTCLPPVQQQNEYCGSLTTLVKVGIDQFIQAPILLALMISMLSILKGQGMEGVKHDLHENFWNALVANWKLWLPASAINMLFVKPSLRVLYVNVVFFVWTIILSLMLQGGASNR